MRDQPLIDILSATFQHLEARLEEHRQMLAYQTAQQTIQFLHQQLKILRRELHALRGATITWRRARGDPSNDYLGGDLWRRTVNELRQMEPRQFRSPTSAITSANTELYELIAYLGAAIALTRERRRAVTATLVQRREDDSAEPPESVEPAELRDKTRVEATQSEQDAIYDLLELAAADEDASFRALQALVTSLAILPISTQTRVQDDSNYGLPEG